MEVTKDIESSGQEDRVRASVAWAWSKEQLIGEEGGGLEVDRGWEVEKGQ